MRERAFQSFERFQSADEWFVRRLVGKGALMKCANEYADLTDVDRRAEKPSLSSYW